MKRLAHIIREVWAGWAKRRERIDRLFAWINDPDNCRASHLKDVKFTAVVLQPYGIEIPCPSQLKPTASYATR